MQEKYGTIDNKNEYSNSFLQKTKKRDKLKKKRRQIV